MASALVTSVQTAYLTHMGCANSFFNGNSPSELGNIESATGADQLRNMYNNTAAMQWTGPIDTQNVPAIDDAGQFAVVETLTAITSLGADYQCRRAASIITSALSISHANVNAARATPLPIRLGYDCQNNLNSSESGTLGFLAMLFSLYNFLKLFA